MSLEQQVQSKIEKNILTLTLNRPEVLNALNETLCDQLFEQLASAEKNSSIRCIVIRGAGKHFMAGGDLKLFHSELNKKPDKRRIFFEKFVYNVHPLVQVIKRIPKPVLASVHGAVGGFGVSLMLVCDLVIAADSSYFTMAYGNIGTSPDGSSTYFLPRSVGLKKAMELSLLCDRFDANTANFAELKTESQGQDGFAIMNFTTDKRFQAISIDNVSFDGGSESVIFDPAGGIVASDGSPSTGGSFTLHSGDHSWDIALAPLTGKISVQSNGGAP